MKFQGWVLAALAVFTVAGNANGLARFYANGVRMARTWVGGFRGSGEHVDAARRMTETALARGWSIAYCQPYDDRLTSVDRSRILAMSWATAPCPVRYGNAAELRGFDAVVASAYGLDLGTDRGLGDQYHVVDSCGGLALWAKKPKAGSTVGRNMPPVFRDMLAAAALMALVSALLLVGGIECMILGVCAVSVLMFMQVACLRSIDRIGAVVVAMLVLAAAAFFRQIGRHVGRQSNCEALPGMSSGLCCGQMRWLAVSICIFIVYAVFTLTHTFVAPTGLGTVGGKAKLLFLSIGFPRGFFTDTSFMLYQPPYPPGGALFLLWGYVFSGGCGEWIVQVVNCCFAAVLLGFFLSRLNCRPACCLVVAFFVSPLTFRLVTLFYPEIMVGLCMIAGWNRVRRHPQDWIGWIVMGMAGWFKNEGLVYCCAIALPVFFACRRKLRGLVLLRALSAIAFPLAWHVGCRICGASLDGFLPVSSASAAKFLLAAKEIVVCCMLSPWQYGFVFPLALLCAFMGMARSRNFRVVGTAVVVSMFAFCAIFSVSGASDFRWHLESMERLLWVPAVMLMQELTARIVAFATIAVDTPKVSVVKWHYENR